jgi:hypothetical protein
MDLGRMTKLTWLQNNKGAESLHVHGAGYLPIGCDAMQFRAAIKVSVINFWHSVHAHKLDV